jgi:hypothetical protein
MQNIHKFIALGSLSLIGFLYACDNTVDINDEYKEITLVYGLLDRGESTHYIKITKAFLSESNIYLTAQDPKASQYGVEELEVWMEEWDNNGVFRQTIYLDTALITNKEEGVFYAPEQIVYKTENGVKLDKEFTYKLYIKNLTTGKLIDAETKMIKDVVLNKPNPNSSSLGLTGLFASDLQWRNGENALIYDIAFRFFYTEINAANDTSSHYVDWEIGSARSPSTEQGELVSTTYYGPNFYSYLGNSMELPEAGMVRYSDSIHLILYAGNEDLSIYMDVNAPSNSIVQERPQYTNITNGMGIFGSRYRFVKSYKSLVPRSLDSLYTGQYTKKLGFVSRPL